MNRIRSIFIYFFVASLFLSCKPEKKFSVDSKDELYVYLDAIENRYENAYRKTQAASRKIPARDGIADFYASHDSLTELLSDTSARNIIIEWRARSGSLADKSLSRRLELWYRAFIGGSFAVDPEIEGLKNSLEQKISKFRFTVNGRKISQAELVSLIRKQKKQNKREKLFLEFNKLAKATADDYKQFVKLHNETAKSWGFPDYYSLTLYIQGIDERWLLRVLGTLEKFTKPQYEELIASSKIKMRGAGFYPWDLVYTQPEFASIPDKYFRGDSLYPVISRFGRAVGFDPDSLPVKTTLLKGEKECAVFIMSIPDDVRIVFAQKPGISVFSSALFCYGRAVHAVSTEARYPILKGYGWVPGTYNPAYLNGTALFFGKFTEDSAWIATYIGPRETELGHYLLKRQTPQLYALRRELKEFFTEYEIFRNPEQNLDSLETSMAANFLLTDTLAGEKLHFFANPDYVSSPCGSHTGLFEKMIAAQLQEASAGKFGNNKISGPAVAEWLTEHLYAGGETLEWPERIRNATGKTLDPGALLRSLGVKPTSLPAGEVQEGK